MQVCLKGFELGGGHSYTLDKMLISDLPLVALSGGRKQWAALDPGCSDRPATDILSIGRFVSSSVSATKNQLFARHLDDLETLAPHSLEAEG